MLESYLSNAPRSYAIHGLANEQMNRAVNTIHALILKVFLRMATIIESKVICIYVH